MISANDVIGWLRWADETDNEVEKEIRTERVWAYVFPKTLDDAERSRREGIVEQLKRTGEPASWAGFPAPTPPPDSIPTVPSAIPIAEAVGRAEKKKEEEPAWEGLISPKSPAYRRGSLHDGTAQEVGRMRDIARGSPFNAEDDYRQRPKDPRKK